MSRQGSGTEADIALAMLRLLAGKPLVGDEALTSTNLAREATVSRATLYRYPALLELWNESTCRIVTPDAAQAAERQKNQVARERDARRSAEVIAEGLAAAYVELVRRFDAREGIGRLSVRVAPDDA